MTTLTCKGIKFRNMIELCDYYDINLNYFRLRRITYKELTIEEIIDKCLKDGEIDLRSKPIEYNKIKYGSYRELCNDQLVCYKQFISRKKRNPEGEIETWLFGKKKELQVPRRNL